MILRDLMEDEPIAVCGKEIRSNDVECAVARIDENTNTIQNILALTPLDLGDLGEIEEDVDRLLAKDGRLKRIASTQIHALDYQLNEKCNTYIFNVYCLPESGIRHSLELLGIEPSIARALRSAGIVNLDQLAELDLESAQALHIRSKRGFSKSLEVLKEKAAARLSTLPGVGINGPLYKVRYLPFSGTGQLPEHAINGRRLIRVYLAVDYDYVENRVGALSAHVTNSEGKIYTGFVKSTGGWRPDPQVKEAWSAASQGVGYSNDNYRTLDEQRSKHIELYKNSQWTGCYDEDTACEGELIRNFLHSLVESIVAVEQSDRAPIHFYVWSRSEMSHLVEACSRVGTVLLRHLNELLGCREGLDQLIFSCLEEEVDNRFALGWTGRGLVVATSLLWFGWRYHWVRRVNHTDVDLEKAFTQDLFDFKTTLSIKKAANAQTEMFSVYEWARKEDTSPDKHRFEIRSRFFDSLPAPYWHAVWSTLPTPEDLKDARVANAIKRYQHASKPGYLRAYLIARTQALRWIEERIRPKNIEISKPSIDLRKIKQFSLGVNNVSQAAIDVLRLDAHVKVRDWTAAHLIPPAYRIFSGRTIPIKNVYSKWNPDRKTHELVASINVEDYNIEPEVLVANCSISQGSFVRVTPCGRNPTEGQHIRQLRREGSTSVVLAIDWIDLTMVLDVKGMASSNYWLQSMSHREEGLIFEYATVDESPSEFVAARVERALLVDDQAPVYRWLDPQNRAIPSQNKLEAKARAKYNKLLKSKFLPDENRLIHEQREACLDGLSTRIQLLHGPPGTGKTITTAAAVLLRILACLSVGDVVLLAASTHTAVDILLQNIDILENSFRNQAISNGLIMPPIKLAKAVSSPDNPRPSGRIDIIESKPAKSIGGMISDSVAVIGGTTSSILKLWNKKGKRLKDLQAALLVIDEASMMVFPNFLALATLISVDRGQIMLAGDHQQLQPIVAHDWENEDRPPVVLYQPYTSAFVAVQNIGRKEPDPSKIFQSPLRFSFRLPLEIRELINRLYRQEVELHGPHGTRL